MEFYVIFMDNRNVACVSFSDIYNLNLTVGKYPQINKIRDFFVLIKNYVEQTKCTFISITLLETSVLLRMRARAFGIESYYTCRFVLRLQHREYTLKDILIFI